MQIDFRTPARFSLVLLIPGFLGAILVFYATAVWGAGVNGDSIAYYNAGENLLSEGTLTIDYAAGAPEPLIHFPPLYPAILAPLHLANMSIVHSVRSLNVLLFVLYIFGIEMLVLRATDGSITAALVAGTYVALSTAALTVYARMWSETVYLVLFVFGSLWLCRFLDDGSWAPFVGASALFGLAWLARYAGITLIVCGMLAVMLWSREPYRRRFGRALFLGAVAAVPMGLFLVRNYAASDHVTSRVVAYHPPQISWWRNGMDTFSAWLIPIASPGWMKGAVALAVIAVALASVAVVVYEDRSNGGEVRDKAVRAWVVPAVLLLFSGIYVGFLFAIANTMDPVNLNARMLSPVHAAMIVVASYVATRAVRSVGTGHPALAASLVLILCGGLLLVQAARSVVWTQDARVDGFEFSARSWRTAPALDALMRLPDDTPIYSNRPQVVYFLTGRRAYSFAYADCVGSCQIVADDLAALPVEHKDSAVLVWIQGQSPNDCLDCLLGLAPAYNFVSILEDERIELLASSVAE